MSYTLNRQQYLAATPRVGVNLVIAGAGTGKTSALIQKAENLITAGLVRTDQVLILTFSRKAADELRERIMSRIRERGSGITTGTFHSFCYAVIREFSSLIGFDDSPGIIDSDYINRFIDRQIRSRMDHFKGLPVAVIRNLLEHPPPPESPARKNLDHLGITDSLLKLTGEIRGYKQERNLLEYEDLMDITVQTLETNAVIRNTLLNRYRFIMVDEFQDTSENNFRLLKQLIDPGEPGLFVVGDDWQSIYGFRNARLEYIVNMKKFFPTVETIKLRINYRSKKEIVELSNRFIRKNRYRTSKKLVSHAGKGGTVRAFSVEGFEEECRCIKMITSSMEGEVCVLYRNNWQGTMISKHLSCPENSTSGMPVLMTMHASKGLEFDCVIIAGISDKIMPDSSSDIEEERRLLYVGLTRARNKLYLIFHENEKGNKSRFASELGVRSEKFSVSAIPE